MATDIDTDLLVATPKSPKSKCVRAYMHKGGTRYLLREWPAGTFWVVNTADQWNVDPAEIPGALGPFAELGAAHATAVLMGVM